MVRENGVKKKRLSTYTCDFLHIMLSKLLTPDETLNTREMSQKRFTSLLNWSN